MALSFDANYYLSARPDVWNAFVKAGGSTGLTWVQFAQNHYNTFGRFEGSNPNATFNTTEYLTANPDVAAAGVNPFQHFLQFGVNEGRAPSASFPTFASFDFATYLSSNLDLGAAGITTKAQAWAHFVVFGEFENRPGTPAVDTGIKGTTFTLTTAADTGAAFTGTANNDTFNANVDTVLNSTNGTLVNVDTAQNIDTLNGGAGIDTLNIVTKGAVSLPSLTSIEVVNVQALDDNASIDTSSVTDIKNLNITKVLATKTVGATAAATTDIGVSVKASGDITVNGGKDVNVTSTDSTAAITVGATTAAAGAVTVVATGAAAKNNVDVTLGKIAVTGGKTISVTQKATSDASAIKADATTETHTQGNVEITADATTTDVTVKQDAAVAAASVAAVAGVTEVANVKFADLAKDATVTVGGLTFTAAKDLTAAQVAQAFANLDANAIKPTSIAGPTTATGDTQGSGVTANGTFSGSLAANWNSAAASGDTVVFTGKANTSMTNLTATSATVTTVTEGVAAVAEKNTLGVVAGTVAITGGAALKTVSVDGYAASANGVTGTTNSALSTINLSNGTDFKVSHAASAVALTLNKVNGTVDIASGTTTINAVVNNGTTDVSTLKSASAETVNVSGAGNVAGTTATDLAAATAINTSGMTGGNATFTIADGTKTTYTGGAGVDSVTITNGATAITKAVDLGAGDDTLTLGGTTAVVSTATLKGGAGTDTIAMTGASAVSLSANGNFAGKIEGFEKLSITDKVAVTSTIDMANMDGITYVVSGNSTAVNSAAVDENGLVTFKDLTAGQSVTVAGRTVTVSAGSSATAAEIASAFLTGNATTTNANNTLTVSGSLTNWTAASNAAGVLKFTSTTAGSNVANDLSTTISDAPLAAATAVDPGTKTDGAGGTAEKTDWTMKDLTNGQSYTLAGVTVTALKALAAADVAAAFAAGTSSANNYEVSGTYAKPDNSWTGGTFSSAGATLTLTNGANGDVADFTTAPTANSAGTSPTDAAVSDYVQGAPAGATTAVGLTFDHMVNNSTLELVDAGAGVIVKMADASGTADSFNLVTKVGANDLSFGTLKIDGVETLTYHALDTAVPPTTGATVNTASLTLTADKATSLTIDGSSNVNLTLTGSDKLVTIDAHALTGGLTATAHGAAAMTITGGTGNDVLTASASKADILSGGAGADTLVAGNNGAQLTGGDGNDKFILTSKAAAGGNLEANTYSTITDFKAGDLLQLQSWHFAGGGGTSATVDIKSFSHLTASLDANTAVFTDFVNKAIEQAGVDQAVWFNYKGDAYVVVDSDTESATFDAGHDLVVKLTGVNGDNLSYNSAYGSVALV